MLIQFKNMTYALSFFLSHGIHTSRLLLWLSLYLLLDWLLLSPLLCHYLLSLVNPIVVVVMYVGHERGDR